MPRMLRWWMLGTFSRREANKVDWFRDPERRPQAVFALHAGRLLADYFSLTENRCEDDGQERYEATLTVCVLQSLLTNCTELLTTMETEQKAIFGRVISDKPTWGIQNSQFRNTFPDDPPTLARVLKHMRNGLSHPTVPQPEVEFPTTGYSTTNASERVTAFRVTTSPWAKDGRRFGRKRLPSSEAELARILKEDFHWKSRDGFLEFRHHSDGSVDAWRGGSQYWPFFVIELPLETMVGLTINLADHLAQPYDGKWNGRTHRRLVRDRRNRSTSGSPRGTSSQVMRQSRQPDGLTAS